MSAVTEIDRKAAEELRVLLADMCGFWFSPADTGPLVAALARHRETCELSLLEKISNSSVRMMPADRMQTEMPVAYDNRMTRPRTLAVSR